MTEQADGGRMDEGLGSEAQLLRRAGEGDEAAFALLYERHRSPVFRFTCRMLGSQELAEDVTQECFLAILRRPGGFQEGRASLRTYLCGIARHLAFKQLRRRGQETLTDETPEPEPEGAPTAAPLQYVMDDEAAGAVRGAVSDLPPLQREAIVLFEYEGLSLAEIASVCDTDVGTVKARLHRARGRLKRSLAPYLAAQSVAI